MHQMHSTSCRLQQENVNYLKRHMDSVHFSAVNLECERCGAVYKKKAFMTRHENNCKGKSKRRSKKTSEDNNDILGKSHFTLTILCKLCFVSAPAATNDGEAMDLEVDQNSTDKG